MINFGQNMLPTTVQCLLSDGCPFRILLNVYKQKRGLFLLTPADAIVMFKVVRKGYTLLYKCYVYSCVAGSAKWKVGCDT